MSTRLAHLRASIAGFPPRLQGTWLVLPAVIVIVAVLIVPVGLLLSLSFDRGFANYADFLGQAALVRILWRTIGTALFITGLSFVLGYPFAYLMASSGPRARNILLAIVTSSLFISVVVRCYAWLAILDRGGVLNTISGAVGAHDFQIVGVHNLAGVVVGVLQYSLPLMILPIYDVMLRTDTSLMRAAASLGANSVRSFFRVYLPQTIPGVVAGSSVVFVATLGYYIIPSILGGPQNEMIGELIATTITTTVQWELASTIASLLFAASMVFFVIFYLVTSRRSAANG
jgi:ABC-type spermidine/putrescine transport system permease subunit I